MTDAQNVNAPNLNFANDNPQIEEVVNIRNNAAVRPSSQLVQIRDRLFQVLFYRFSIVYARTVPKFARRIFEFLTLTGVSFSLYNFLLLEKFLYFDFFCTGSSIIFLVDIHPFLLCTISNYLP